MRRTIQNPRSPRLPQGDHKGMRRREILASGTRAGIALFILGKRVWAGEKRSAIAPSSTDDQSPALHGVTAWINSPPITEGALRGKVTLIEFWTYTCVNWRRTLPYVRAWADKYQNHGLLVIGVHTPEFSFERDIDNVRRATSALEIAYPVAVDSHYAVWNAFKNQYWPALYVIDSRGHVRHRQFGEGGYQDTERIIQQTLIEAGNVDFARGLVHPSAEGAAAAADVPNLRSPETYLGYEKAERFVTPADELPNIARKYSVPSRLRLNQWALSGNWTVQAEAISLQDAGGRVVYRFHARDINLIMGAAGNGRAVRFRVGIDGQPPAAAHGVDVDADGSGHVSEPRMYQLIRQPGVISDRTFDIEFLDRDVNVYDFTFG